MSASIYRTELTEFGFDEWPEHVSGSQPGRIESIPDERLPCFCHFEIGTVRMTFVVDEKRGFWVAAGFISLSDLGFHEAEFSGPASDDPPFH